MKNKFLGIPYIIWMAIFVVIPLFLILGYALTTRDGGITLENFTKLASYTGVFADSFLLAIIATLVCLIIGYPHRLLDDERGTRLQAHRHDRADAAHVDELSAAYLRLDESAGEHRHSQRAVQRAGHFQTHQRGVRNGHLPTSP